MYNPAKTHSHVQSIMPFQPILKLWYNSVTFGRDL